MHIKINTKDKNVNLRLPNSLLFNKVAYNIICKLIQKEAKITIDKKLKDQIYQLLKASMNEYKGLTIVEVHSADNEEVLIKL